MATAHQLAVITNSCVKTPSNPNSGLSFTSDERALADRSELWHGRDADFLGGPTDLADFQASRSYNFDSTNTMMETVIPDLNELSDAEFYRRLVDLRTEHKKTLEMCEHLYSEKLRETARIDSPERRSSIPVATVDADYTMSTMPPSKSPSVSFEKTAAARRIPQGSGHTRDKLRDMSFSKPPTGRQKESNGMPVKSGTPKIRHAQTCKNGSYDDKVWKTVSANSTDVDFSSSRTSNKSPDQVDLATRRIDEMWKEFSIEDYAPRALRQRSNSFSGSSNNEEKSDWRHRVTIPKPFKMTVREECKAKKKTQNIEEYERKKVAELRSEHEECEKKFKATPVPAHVYMPLFDEIMEEKESKRRYAREASNEILLSQQKPFKFHTREEEKQKVKRMQSAPLSEKNCEDIRASQNFRANPFPEHLFSDTVTDRMQEEEEYRRIRKQMRSEDLLKSSSLPPNMKTRGQDFIDEKSRQKKQAERAKRAGITVQNKFKPKINDDIPDFEDLHRKFHSKLSERKYAKEATVCKPFNLRTERIPSKKHNIYDDIARDEESLRENRWPFTGSRARPFTKSSQWAFGTSLSSSMDSLPTKMTTAASLRHSSSRNKLQRQIDRELSELERERRRRLREKELKRVISKKAAANDQTIDLRKSTDDKIREHKAAERERMAEYQVELKRMYANVKTRPLLFEQTIQKNAEQRAQRKYYETLKNAGLDDDFVTSRGKWGGGGDDDLGLSEEEDSYRIPYDDTSRHSSIHSTYSDTRSASQHYTNDFDASGADGDKTDEENSIHEELEDME